MPGNSFGQAFRFTTWGESHGPAIGCVVDGVPPGLQRREPDAVSILSGVFEGHTTGAPISMVIENKDQRPRDYSEIKELFRPGHADYTYWKKYGHRDYRGGGRSSARETAMRVAAGAVARKVLGENVVIRGAMVQMGPHAIDRDRWDWAAVEENPFWCPDREAAAEWERHIEEVRKAGSSTGAIIEVTAAGVPAGLGEPVYDKLDAEIAKAMMSINAVKGVEIGTGFAAAAERGEDAHDEMRMEKGEVVFLSNKAGGTLGGISTGQNIVVRFAVKPTSSILIPRRGVTVAGEEAEVATKGRHDPCVGIRAVPVGEAMLAIVLADHLLRHRAQCG